MLQAMPIMLAEDIRKATITTTMATTRAAAEPVVLAEMVATAREVAVVDVASLLPASVKSATNNMGTAATIGPVTSTGTTLLPTSRTIPIRRSHLRSKRFSQPGDGELEQVALPVPMVLVVPVALVEHEEVMEYREGSDKMYEGPIKTVRVVTGTEMESFSGSGADQWHRSRWSGS
jgi:hypothetical protein